MDKNTVGSVKYDASIDLASLKKSIAEADKLVEKSYKKQADAAKKSTGVDTGQSAAQVQARLAAITREAQSTTQALSFGLGAVKVAAVAAGAAIAVNLGGAVSRLDTLNNFPRVLEAMGESSDAAESATKKLADRLQGLPTPLQDGTRGVQAFIAAGLPVGVATEGFLALNNAFLAGGASSQAASQSMVQLQQALSRGRIEGQEWNSIVANTPTFLKAMALETGKTREELRELYRTSPETLIRDMIRLNTEGGGGLASLDQQARALTDGIGTAFDNMNTAIQRSIASILDGIGKDNITGAITGIGAAFESTGRVIGGVATVLQPIAPVITAVAIAAGALTLGLGGVATAATLATKAMAVFNIALHVIRRHPVIAAVSLLATAVLGVAAAVGIMNNDVEEIKTPALDVEDALKGWAPAINQSAGAADNLGRRIAKINEQMEKVREDYRYSLAELVRDKNKNIAQLLDTLDAEKKAYNNSLAERTASFEKNENEQLLTHRQKTRALQKQIDFLTKYNNSTNAQQLSELKFALARENAEYAKSTELRQNEFDAQTKSASEQYEKRRKENQTKLDQELALLEKHREDVLSVRNVMLRDEIENLKHRRDEQLKALQEQRDEVVRNATDIMDYGKQTSTAFDGTIAKFDRLATQSSTFAGNLLQAANNASTLQNTANSSTFQNAMKNLQGVSTAQLLQSGTQKSLTVTGSGSNQVIKVDYERRAFGGPVEAGSPYLVGENPDGSLNRTSELFVPRQSGSIVSAKDLQSMLGGGTTVNVTINPSGIMASTKADLRQIATQMARLINEQVTANTGKVAIQGI